MHLRKFSYRRRRYYGCQRFPPKHCDNSNKNMNKSPVKDPEEGSSSSGDEYSSGSSSSGSRSSSCSDGSRKSFSVLAKPVYPEKLENADSNCNVLVQPVAAETDDREAKLEEMVEQVEKYCKDKYQSKLSAEFKAELPTIDGNLVSDLDRVLRMPHFMPVEPKAYEAHSFKDALRPEDLNDREARDAFITKLMTTVRWRECQDKTTGALYKESNARIVRWSDGSETFHVGGEAFDVVNHPMPAGQNQLYVRQGSYYHMQGPIKDKLSLRPKLESSFGQSHVQGLRKLAFYKPVNSCVKVLMDLSTNPALDRERKAKEEQAQERKEKSDKRREQKNQRKPRVKPMRHCTADDTDMETSIQTHETEGDRNLDEQDENPNPVAVPPEVKRTPGIRTNRNTDIKPTKYEDGSDDDDEDEEDQNNNPANKGESVEQPKLKPETNTKSSAKQLKPKLKRKQAILSDSE
ncbi:RNA polymerase-associated protein LEO1 isoform X2 [Drosophila montana]|uniref:RNA polymerase-associated protein LEO1 isoform X2 n=1 Tax=Drosophila montana TaxID=40370 RepID=UPI00313DAC76